MPLRPQVPLRQNGDVYEARLILGGAAMPPMPAPG
jgi:hypothetical protein